MSKHFLYFRDLAAQLGDILHDHQQSMVRSLEEFSQKIDKRLTAQDAKIEALNQSRISRADRSEVSIEVHSSRKASAVEVFSSQDEPPRKRRRQVSATVTSGALEALEEVEQGRDALNRFDGEQSFSSRNPIGSSTPQHDTRGTFADSEPEDDGIAQVEVAVDAGAVQVNNDGNESEVDAGAVQVNGEGNDSVVDERNVTVAANNVENLVDSGLKTLKGKRVCLFRGYEFVLKEFNVDGSARWRCREFNSIHKCGVSLTASGMRVVRFNHQEHTHVVIDRYPEVQEVESRILQEARTSRDLPSKVCARVFDSLDEDVAIQVATLKPTRTLVRKIQKERAKDPSFRPFNQNPSSLDFEIDPALQPFVLYDDRQDPALGQDINKHRVVILGDLSMVKRCESANGHGKLGGDGTFFGAPKPFLQIYTLHPELQTIWPPALYGFLPSKEKIVYEKFFRAVRFMLNDNVPTNFLLDFETSCWLGLRSAFQHVNVSIQGCFFHLTKSWTHHMKTCGFANDMNENTNFRKAFFMAVALTAVPPAEVVDTFHDLKNSRYWLDEPAFHELDRYLTSTYIEGDMQANGHREPLFPIDVWNCRVALLNQGQRTNNGVEGWHNAFNKMLGRGNPTFGECAGVIVREELAKSKQRAREVDAGNAPPIPPSRKRFLDVLRRQMLTYRANNRINFLRAFSIATARQRFTEVRR
jgi:hypothetical protein